MARKTASRLELRKQAEAAESAGTKSVKKKRKATKKRKTKRSKAEVVRHRLMWGIFSGSMKEEGRFPYDQLKEAEEKIEQLRSKSKRLYFIQPIKVPITEAPETEADAEAAAKE